MPCQSDSPGPFLNRPKPQQLFAIVPFVFFAPLLLNVDNDNEGHGCVAPTYLGFALQGFSAAVLNLTCFVMAPSGHGVGCKVYKDHIDLRSLNEILKDLSR